jgi:flagellar biosynthesis protein FlhG
MPDQWIDQAEGLRKLLVKAPPQIVTLCSAMPEPGRPWALLNLAAALKQAGSGVLILDGAAGQAGGLMACPVQPIQFKNILEGNCSISQAISMAPEQIPVIAAQSGLDGLVEALSENHSFSRQLKLDSGTTEVLLVNTLPNAHGLQCPDALLGQEMVITVRPERSSVSATYELIKSLCERSSQRTFRLLISGNPDVRESQRLHKALSSALARTFNVNMTLLGVMPSDRNLHHAASQGRAVVASHPNTFSAASFRKMADSLIRCRTAGLPRLGVPTSLVPKINTSSAISLVRG